MLDRLILLKICSHSKQISSSLSNNLVVFLLEFVLLLYRIQLLLEKKNYKTAVCILGIRLLPCLVHAVYDHKLLLSQPEMSQEQNNALEVQLAHYLFTGSN